MTTAPTPLALKIAALAAGMALVGMWDVRAALVGCSVFAMLWLTIWAIGLLLRKAEQPITIERQLEGLVQVDRPLSLVVTATNQSNRRQSLTLLQTFPDTIACGEPLNAMGWHTLKMTLAPREQGRWHIPIRPTRRGPFALPPFVWSRTDATGLVTARQTIDDALTSWAQPDMSQVRLYDQLRRTRALKALGVHRQRQLGQGREFDQIREYQSDDDYRNINWKATARTGQPMTNLYQAERSRDVLVCVDGGRLMGDPLTGGKTILDHAIDAAGLLMHAACDQGDRVGLLTFRDRLHRYHKPQRSAAARQLMLKTLASFDSQPIFTNYLAMSHTLRSQLSHRSLVILLTHLADPQLAEDLAEALPPLKRRHMVVVVGLEDQHIEHVATGPADTAHDVNRVLAANRLCETLQAHRQRIRHTGVDLVTAEAENLSMAVINQYLRIRAKQLL